MVYSVIVMIKYLLFLRPIVMLLTFIISSITTTSYSQSIGRNYILARTFTDSIGKSSLDSVYYYDGLGRLEQTILRNAFLQGEDIVTLQEYDLLGRPSNRWNPVGIQGNEGLYVASENLTTRAVSFYKDTHPYSKPVYEASPLSRIREQYGPGEDWHTRRRSVKTDHFLYDNLSRLTEASYLENGQPNNHFSTPYRYDMQGNMLNLKRKGLTDSNKEDMLDDLSFTYKGNQLADCMYDANGNQINDKRKGISEMAYNHLNLPSRITFDNGNSITYLYDAAGTKRQTRHVTEADTLVTDYCSNVIYENGIAKTLLVDGGYVALSDRSYHYFIHDHQGNVRIVADKDGKVEERNDYYPFGGLMASSTTSAQPYKYNGKELDSKNGLSWYDYGARHYDPVIGRWKTMDPLAEMYYSWSPYAYCKDNPVNRIDPDGKALQIPPTFLWGISNPVIAAGSRISILSSTDKLIRIIPKENHHIIPRSLRKTEVVKATRKGGFKLEGEENKLSLEKFIKATGEGRHAKHPRYTEQLREKFERFTKENSNVSPKHSAEFVRKELLNAKKIIENNPNTKINDLILKNQVLPTDGITVPKLFRPITILKHHKYL